MRFIYMCFFWILKTVTVIASYLVKFRFNRFLNYTKALLYYNQIQFKVLVDNLTSNVDQLEEAE